MTKTASKTSLKTIAVTGILAATTILNAPALAGGHAGGLDGATVVITNTFQGAQTEGAEMDVAAFGMMNNVFATVGDAMEFPGFITLYDVEITGDSIAFTWLQGESADSISGPTPEGNHDRNYFVFDLPEGKAITAVAFDPDASELLEGSAEPTIAIVGPNRIVTDFSSGVVRGVGFNPAFSITVSDAQ